MVDSETERPARVSNIARTPTVTHTSTIARTPTVAGHRLVRFSGKALDAENTPMKGVVGVTFAIYEEQSGGAPLWQETQNLTADEYGRFNAVLGVKGEAGIPPEVFSGDSRWLGVLTHSPGAVEQSRVLLMSVPYALKSEDSAMLGGKPASAYVTVDAMAQAQTATPAAARSNLRCAFVDTAASLVAKNASAGFVPVFSDAAGNLESSAIVQSNSNIGIGTSTPDKPLTVNGAIHSASGGFVFPDGSVMTTAVTQMASGTNLVLPAGSGTSGAGNVQLQTQNTSTNTAIDRLIIAGTPKAMSGAVPMANLFSIHIANGDAAGGRVKFTIVASNGTNYAMETGEMAYLASPKQITCAVVTSQISQAPPGYTNTVLAIPPAGQPGFLNAQCNTTWASSGDPMIQIFDAAPMAFTPTTHKVYYTIENQSQSAITLQ